MKSTISTICLGTTGYIWTHGSLFWSIQCNTVNTASLQVCSSPRFQAGAFQALLGGRDWDLLWTKQVHWTAALPNKKELVCHKALIHTFSYSAPSTKKANRIQVCQQVAVVVIQQTSVCFWNGMSSVYIHQNQWVKTFQDCTAAGYNTGVECSPGGKEITSHTEKQHNRKRVKLNFLWCNWFCLHREAFETGEQTWNTPPPQHTPWSGTIQQELYNLIPIAWGHNLGDLKGCNNNMRIRMNSIGMGREIWTQQHHDHVALVSTNTCNSLVITKLPAFIGRKKISKLPFIMPTSSAGRQKVDYFIALPFGTVQQATQMFCFLEWWWWKKIIVTQQQRKKLKSHPQGKWSISTN